MKNAGCWNYFQNYLSGLVAFISLFSVIESAIACGAPPEVCEWKKKIVGLKTNNMVASGILLDGGLIITNRHVVEDHQSVLVRDYDGNIDSAGIIPHNIQVDLAILARNSKNIVPNVTKGFSDARSQTLYVVAFDQGRNASRVYKPSSFAYYPNLKKYPLARIHSNAKALPGNSGGAVVGQQLLVGILASGDRRFVKSYPQQN